MFSRRARDMGGDLVTVVGPEASFAGTLSVKGSVRVEGKVEGNIIEAKTVVVGAQGKVCGDIAAESAVIGGELRGNVAVSIGLELISGGRVHGDIQAPKLSIEEGAFFDGRCRMGAAAAKSNGAAPRSRELARADSL